MLIDSRLLLKQQQHENVEIDVLQTNKKKKMLRQIFPFRMITSSEIFPAMQGKNFSLINHLLNDEINIQLIFFLFINQKKNFSFCSFVRLCVRECV